MYGVRRGYTGFWWGTCGRRPPENQGVDGRIILKWIFTKWVAAWTDLAQDRDSWRVLVSMVMNFRVP
jgi:hypothetical protein